MLHKCRKASAEKLPMDSEGEPDQYVIMFPDGTLYVDCLFVLLLMNEVGIEFEPLGKL